MKIAILLEENAGIASRWRAKALAETLLDETSPDGEAIEIAIGLPRTNEVTWRKQEAELRAGNNKIIVRHLEWERVPTEMAYRMFPQAPVELEFVPDCALPRDWGWNFVDCDAWVVFSSREQGAVFPIKPTSYFVRDLAERFVPKAYAPDLHSVLWERQKHAFRAMRHSRVAAVSTSSTGDDVSGYAGVRRNRILEVPQLLPRHVKTTSRKTSKEKHLLWFTAANANFDIENALEALRIYQADGGTMKVTLVSEDAHLFDPATGQTALLGIPSQTIRVTNSIAFETVQFEADLQRLLNRADAIWSSAIAEGENEGLIRASVAGIPFVGFNYPQNRAHAQTLGVSSILYDEQDSHKIADALFAAEVGNFVPAQKSIAQTPSRGWAPLIERLWGA